MVPDHLNYLGAIYGHLKAVAGMLKHTIGITMCVCVFVPFPHPEMAVGSQWALFLCFNEWSQLGLGILLKAYEVRTPSRSIGTIGIFNKIKSRVIMTAIPTLFSSPISGHDSLCLVGWAQSDLAWDVTFCCWKGFTSLVSTLRTHEPVCSPPICLVLLLRHPAQPSLTLPGPDTPCPPPFPAWKVAVLSLDGRTCPHMSHCGCQCQFKLKRCFLFYNKGIKCCSLETNQPQNPH